MTDMTGMTKQEERELAKRLVAEIGRMAETAGRKLRFMEVCGTHTVAIFRAACARCCRRTSSSSRAQAAPSV